MATIQKPKKAATKMVPGEMTGKMYKKSEIDDIGKKQAAELDKVSMFGKEAMKKKAAPKAKDGKWIQKAINPKHKGYCTPMTKATCTPKRKALAKTLKAMGRARKGK
jgi:hypothetical protein